MENSLESYLSAIEAELKDVPAARVTEFTDEVRAHLWAMFEAKRADGLDTATAWLSAMAEFGEPDKVGRDLRAQWANSAQLESEGAPLSRWDLTRKVGWRIVAVSAWVLVMFLLPESAWEQLHKPSVYLLLMLAMMGFQIFRFQRAGKQWTAYNIVSYALVFLMMLLPAVLMQWPDSGDFFAPFALVVAFPMLWLSKREKANRPWQWSTRFKTSPVAAEQEYQFNRVFSLAIGALMGCSSLILIGSRFFGLPLTLLSCAGVIGGAVILGRWLVK